MTIANEPTENKSRDPILGLETDIQKSMDRGFPFLVFSSRLEQHFLADTLNARKNRFSIMVIIAILIYNLFLITDREMLPDVYLTAWKIRLGIVTPAMLISLAIMRWPAFVRTLDFLVDFIVILACGSIILILALSHHPNVVHYHTGIILVVMFGNIVVRLRFWHAFSVSWIIFLIYVLTVTKITPMTTPIMINSCVVLFSAIVISLIANYQMENDLRWNYLRNLLTEIETIRLGKANAELSHLSAYDVLTELANRRHFNDFLDTEWRTGVRYRTQLSLLFLDVDYFKAYNDHYGHQAGDICLQKIAAVIQKCVHRPHDLCARYGGEEFVVLLSNASLESTLQVAEKIRKAVELENIPHAYSPASSHVTISIGVVSIIPHPRLSQNLFIEMADNALYKAKKMGRNQIQVFSPPHAAT